MPYGTGPDSAITPSDQEKDNGSVSRARDGVYGRSRISNSTRIPQLGVPRETHYIEPISTAIALSCVLSHQQCTLFEPALLRQGFGRQPFDHSRSSCLTGLDQPKLNRQGLAVGAGFGQFRAPRSCGFGCDCPRCPRISNMSSRCILPVAEEYEMTKE